MIVLKTKNAVTHIDVDNMVTGGTKSGVVTLTVYAYGMVMTTDNDGNESHIFEAAYSYTDNNGKSLPTGNGNKFEIKSGLMDASRSINGAVGAEDNIVDRMTMEVTEFAKAQFASRFGIDVSEIE